MKKDDLKTVTDFSGRMARAILRSPYYINVYYTILQKAYRDITWNEAKKILKDVIRLTPKVRRKKIP
jgi:hypothetical protein